MTVVELCLVLITIFMALMAVCLIFVAVRLLPAIQSIQDMARDIGTAARRLEVIGSEVESLTRDMRKTQTRIDDVVTLALDQVEPPLRHAAAIISGVRAGLAALLRGKRQ